MYTYESTGSGVVFASSNWTDVFVPKMGIYFYGYDTGKIETLLPDGLFSILTVGLYGDKVFFHGTDTNKHGVGQNKNLYLLKDGAAKLHCEIDSGVPKNPVAKADGIYYLSYNKMNLALFKADSAGAKSVVCEIEGNIDDFDVAGDIIVCVASGNTKLPEVCIVNGGKPEEVSAFNAGLIANKAMSQFERFDAANDNVNIEGYLMKPFNFDPAKKYPALLYVHGGPKSVFGCPYNHEMAYYSSKGYFIFCCNPRGSDGYGDDFADIRGKYGTIDYDDLMKYTDAVMQKYPQIDENRMGVFGKSYGGYMTDWITGHTNRFKCAVSRATIANLFTKGLTTDIGFYHNLYQQASSPWDNPDKLWWHSPLKYADKIKTPTLYIQGDVDYRTWTAEPLQMFTALKMHGFDSRVCLVHGENHFFNIKPLSLLTVFEESSAWFEKYLGL